MLSLLIRKKSGGGAATELDRVAPSSGEAMPGSVARAERETAGGRMNVSERHPFHSTENV